MAREQSAALRRLPAVDALLRAGAVQSAMASGGRELVTAAAREVLAQARQAVQAGAPAPEPETLAQEVTQRVAQWLAPTLRPAINATGVILQTNLGRAPLSQAALAAMQRVAAYSNLEFDLQKGERSSRYVHAEEPLRRLTGAEAALVVNNNAAAVLLALSSLASEREVIVSRGQLVEIGGGFRIPEVLQQSGARLVEVGTTNRTYARDYAAACGPETAALLFVHSSNFRLVGFVHEPAISELAEVAHERGLLLLVDLGSGTLLDTAAFGLAHEPVVQEVLQAGADLVTFSGDKLLGGPQAGIILGRGALVARLRQHPLARALRVDKLTLAALGATLASYLSGRAVTELPVWQMIAAPLAEVERRARRLVRRLRAQGIKAEAIPGRSTIGGGSLPGETLPTCLVALRVPSPNDLARRLRLGEPAIVGRIEGDCYLLDLRTVLPAEEAALLTAVCASLQGTR